MIPTFPSLNPNPSFPITCIILLSLTLLFPFSNLSLSLSKSLDQFNLTKISTMPTKRNLTDFSDSDPLTLPMSNNNKKLRRLPHVFSKVLQLPFNSDADVLIEERPGCLRFVAKTDYDLGEVRAHTVEVYPGVKKVVIGKRENGSYESLGGGLLLPIDEMEPDVWRFRLPEGALLELAKAVYGGGTLVVTVPMSGGECVSKGHGCNEGLGDGVGCLVLVQ
ncbi:hypothetical protein Ancab_013330 [Ancistrocladus abbreviatus]